MTTRGRGSSPEHSAIVMGLAQAARKDKTDFAEAIFEDRSAWESVMKDFLGTDGNIARLIKNPLRNIRQTLRTVIGSPGGSGTTTAASGLMQSGDGHGARSDQDVADHMTEVSAIAEAIRLAEGTLTGDGHGEQEDGDEAPGVPSLEESQMAESIYEAAQDSAAINEVDIFKVVENMLRKFIWDHALPVMMKEMSAEVTTPQSADLRELEAAEEKFLEGCHQLSKIYKDIQDADREFTLGTKLNQEADVELHGLQSSLMRQPQEDDVIIGGKVKAAPVRAAAPPSAGRAGRQTGSAVAGA